MSDNSDERMVLRASLIMYHRDGEPKLVTIESFFDIDEPFCLKLSLKILEDDPRYFDVKQFKAQLIVEELQ